MKRRGNRPAARFIDRNEAMYQSKGKVAVKREGTNLMLLLRSPVICILDMRTPYLFLVVTVAYTLVFLALAPFYYIISDQCALEIDSFIDAYYMSLETIVTIGYGAPDQYYNECPEGAVLLTLQSVIGRILDAMLMGVCIIRMVRGSRRTTTILFTDKAFMNFKHGKLYMRSVLAMHSWRENRCDLCLLLSIQLSNRIVRDCFNLVLLLNAGCGRVVTGSC